LYGNIKAIAAAKRQNAPDLLVIGLAEAKVTVVEWDSETNQLKIVSMHFYENDPDIKVRGLYCRSFLPY